MNKIVNGVANDYEFPNLYNQNISYSKAYTEQLLAEKDKEIERLNNIIDELEKHIKTLVYHDIYGEQIIDSILNKLKELKGEQNEKEIKTETVV